LISAANGRRDWILDFSRVEIDRKILVFKNASGLLIVTLFAVARYPRTCLVYTFQTIARHEARRLIFVNLALKAKQHLKRSLTHFAQKLPDGALVFTLFLSANKGSAPCG